MDYGSRMDWISTVVEGREEKRVEVEVEVGQLV